MTTVYHVSQVTTQLPLLLLSKVCTGCHQEKPLEQFDGSKNTKDGYVERCKECRAQRYRETYVPKPRRKKEIVPIESKVCTKCHIEKPIKEFGRQPQGKNGYKAECNQCTSARHRGYYAVAKETEPTHPLPLTKICIECEQEKPLDDFPVNVTHKDRHDSLCKTCTAIRQHAYDEENKERISQRRKEKHRSNPEHRNKRGREIYAQDIEKSRENNRKRHSSPKARAWQRQYAIDNYDARQEYHAAKNKEWEKTHRTQRLAIKGRRRAIERETIVDSVDYQHILERDGWYCHICCSDIDPDARGNKGLSFDHVKPLAGKGDRKGTHTEDNIKVSHKVCNSRKGTRLLEEMTPYQRRGVA